MKVIVFGATGMVGHGVVRECIADEGVESVLAVVRKKSDKPIEGEGGKVRALVVPDLTDYSAVKDELKGYDACFFCLGVSSAGMTEEAYRKVTVDIAAAAGKVLAEQNPSMTFVLVSGAGTDATGKSGVMWARVKGEAENAIFALPFKASFAFRPAFIRPGRGIVSKTSAYRVGYAILWPFFPLISALFPKSVTSTEKMGRAMLNVARRGFEKKTLENADINVASA